MILPLSKATRGLLLFEIDPQHAVIVPQLHFSFHVVLPRVFAVGAENRSNDKGRNRGNGLVRFLDLAMSFCKWLSRQSQWHT